VNNLPADFEDSDRAGQPDLKNVVRMNGIPDNFANLNYTVC